MRSPWAEIIIPDTIYNILKENDINKIKQLFIKHLLQLPPD